jgi:hypothetical protein
VSQISPDVLRAVTERVIEEFTSAAMMFTALDVSNVVKLTLADARHREISPLVRAQFERFGMGAYIQTSIDVMAGGSKPATAFLYHLPEHPPALYDDTKRNQLAIPPVSASPKDDDRTVTDATTETRVRVGKDGRGRVQRHLLQNAGIRSEQVLVKSEPAGPRLVIVADPGNAGTGAAAPGFGLPYSPTDGGQPLTYEHPTLLHLPRPLIEIFGTDPKLVAKIDGTSVVVVPAPVVS